MCPLGYYTVLRQSKEPTYLGLEMVRYARAQGIKPAARYFHTTVRTVRKWLRRWQLVHSQGCKIAVARRCIQRSGSRPNSVLRRST
jgi:hypothetical protein